MKQIEIENLSFQYGGSEKERPFVLEHIQLQIAAGESVGIIGANGAGKSTFLKLLVGLLSDYTGKIYIEGNEIIQKNLSKIRQMTGYVFQDSESQLFMNTVFNDVAFGPRNYGISQEEVMERVKKALSAVHMEAFADRHIYRLSGGQKKLVAIATILSMDPKMILMDEPSAALDPENRENLIHILNDIKVTKLIASHDLDFIYDTCERTILLSGGQVVYDGRTKELLKNKELLEANGLRLPLSFRFSLAE